MSDAPSRQAPSAPLNPAYDAIRSFLRAQGLEAEQAQIGAPPNPELGDYAVGCFPFAKSTRRPPNALAAELAAAFGATVSPAGESAYGPLNACEASGPYVNFRVDRAKFLGHVLGQVLRHGMDFANDSSGAGKTVVIDYSSPNIAKHLAYHHIRSTMIGHSLRRIWQARGWTVVGINHLGDWGTTFGKLFSAIRRWGGELDLSVDGVTKLNDLYVRFGREAKEHPELAAELEAEGRGWFKRLEEGDVEARALWEQVRAVSLAEYQSVYRELGVEFERVMGESEFEAAMPRVIQELKSRQLTSVSEGALVVDLSADNMPPLLLRKGDGATLYATRDLTALQWRWENLRFDRCLYVVDKGQSLHFKQLFRVAEKAGYECAGRMEHVSFGLVRLGGKKTGTRTGSVVKLRDVLDEATKAVRERITERNPELADADKVARQVGIGAVVFADLKTAREKDVDFHWDDILAFDGDTGPYVQYTHARC
jgi:arginyl-tRNA synthetase